jgi:hypothetical protein
VLCCPNDHAILIVFLIAFLIVFLSDDFWQELTHWRSLCAAESDDHEFLSENENENENESENENENEKENEKENEIASVWALAGRKSEGEGCGNGSDGGGEDDASKSPRAHFGPWAGWVGDHGTDDHAPRAGKEDRRRR